MDEGGGTLLRLTFVDCRVRNGDSGWTVTVGGYARWGGLGLMRYVTGSSNGFASLLLALYLLLVPRGLVSYD